MKTVLLGIDPGQAGRGPFPPGSRGGNRVARLCGLTPSEYLSRFDRVNLYPQPPDRPDDLVAANNLADLLRGRRVVAFGVRPAKAFRVPALFACWSTTGGMIATFVPHLSGLSRWWNDPRNAQAAEGLLRSTLRPCVHVEGPDGSGKTTLVKRIARTLNLRIVPTTGPTTSWSECVDRINQRIAPGIVSDRSSGLVSELVYGPVLRGKTCTDEEEVWKVVRSVCRAITFVYCRPPLEAMAPTFRRTESKTHVLSVKDKLGQLTHRYDVVMSRLVCLGATVVRYDRTCQTVKEVLSCVE